MRQCVVWGICGVAAVLAGCGEKQQTVTKRKLDAAPSTGAVAAFTAPGWKPGDASDWEVQIKRRADKQNEYARTNRN